IEGIIKQDFVLMDSTQSKLSGFPKTLKIGKPPFKISLTWALGILILLWTPLIFFQTWSIQHSDKPFISDKTVVGDPPCPNENHIKTDPLKPKPDCPPPPPPPPDIDLSKMGVLIGVGSVVTVGAIAAGVTAAPAVIVGSAVAVVFYLWSSHQ
ncbi:MAG TPA: hypothetical protein DCQ51_19865, partial [Planktothrix sp. UBA8407]|nr:hypothetical protein [Planktothrix sp. UBA8407]